MRRSLVVLVSPNHEATTAKQRRDEAKHVAEAGVDRFRQHIESEDGRRVSSAQTCVAAWLARLMPLTTVDVYEIDDIGRLPKDSTIVCLGDFSHLDNATEVARLNRRLTARRTIPPPRLMTLAADKSRYYKLLADAGVPVVPSRHLCVRHVRANAQRVADDLHAAFSGAPIILKPHRGGYSVGVRVLKQYAHGDRWRALAGEWTSLGFTDVTVQQYVEEFKHRYEIRTYWFNGVYSHSIATHSDVNEGRHDTGIRYSHALPKSMGGTLKDERLMPRLKAIGRRVHQVFTEQARPDSGTITHSCESTLAAASPAVMARPATTARFTSS